MNIKIDLKEMIQLAKNINLLYVEDDETVRAKTGSLLKLLFQNIDLAQNGEEGLFKYEENFGTEKQFNLIITDINMPYMDGFELSKKVLSLEPNQQIVIVSAYNDADKLEALETLGLENFLHKPLKEDQLLEIMSKVVHQITSNNAKKWE